ncbi:hypothetical protein BH10PSE18_BH10PSE18_40960 [soil metagenome]
MRHSILAAQPASSGLSFIPSLRSASRPFLVRTLRGLVATAAIGLAGTAAMAAGMTVESTAFKDGASIPAEHAGDSGTCGGRNVSLPVAWSNLPANTKSVAVLLSDPDGASGLGVSHWVAYNIPAERGQLSTGEAAKSIPGVTVGVNVAGVAAYRGMCPPVGDQPHHYTLTVVATDVAPGTLPDGLTRDALLAALKGHALGGQSVIGLYAR